MGVGAQNDLEGAPKFCPKIDLNVALQINRFFCPNKGDLQKKRSSLKLRQFFCPNKGDLQKKGLH